MKRLISDAAIFILSVLVLVMFGVSNILTYTAGNATASSSGYSCFQWDNTLANVTLIFLIVLSCVSLILSVIKFLFDLSIIKNNLIERIIEFVILALCIVIFVFIILYVIAIFIYCNAHWSDELQSGIIPNAATVCVWLLMGIGFTASSILAISKKTKVYNVNLRRKK